MSHKDMKAMDINVLGRPEGDTHEHGDRHIVMDMEVTPEIKCMNR